METKTVKPDRDALDKVIEALTPLDDQGRIRVLRTAQVFFGKPRITRGHDDDSAPHERGRRSRARMPTLAGSGLTRESFEEAIDLGNRLSAALKGMPPAEAVAAVVGLAFDVQYRKKAPDVAVAEAEAIKAKWDEEQKGDPEPCPVSGCSMASNIRECHKHGPFENHEPVGGEGDCQDDCTKHRTCREKKVASFLGVGKVTEEAVDLPARPALSPEEQAELVSLDDLEREAKQAGFGAVVSPENAGSADNQEEIRLPKPEDMHGAADGFGGSDYGSHLMSSRQGMGPPGSEVS